MSDFRFPNESDEYRRARDALLDQEVALRDQIEAVAAARRQLPLGGALKEPYAFERVGPDGAVHDVPFDALFGDHSTLLLYSMMFGADWDAPCPSCTSIVDGLDVSAYAVEETCAIAVVAGAGAHKLHDWAARRGWRITLVSGEHNDYLTDYAGFPGDDPGLVSAMNVFVKRPDGIFHFWNSELSTRPMDSGHPRAQDPVWPLWNLLDLTPDGRGDAIVPRQDFEYRVFSERVLAQFDA